MKEYIKKASYREALGLPENVMEEYHMLAQGEYNRNYYFKHPFTEKEYVFRMNYGSQMHLQDQIQYEYNALRLLESSKRTPKVYFVDGSKKEIPQGIMVMEYLKGHPLDYTTELFRAADILADIHAVKIPKEHGLITSAYPEKAILQECEEMFQTYMESPLAPRTKKKTIRHLLDLGWEKMKKEPIMMPYQCCINTELNSTNFLINGTWDYLIDWEKPIYGEPAQDLGHFLAPTTTFWKTDCILTKKQMDAFIQKYIKAVDGRFSVEGLIERTYDYLPITCLRGVTWCAMAWVEYQNPQKEIFNLSTYKKLESYLSDEFLDNIYFHGVRPPYDFLTKKL